MMWTFGVSPGMWLLMAAFIIGLWVVVAMLVRAIFSGGSGSAEAAAVSSPLHVLLDRLARGEITIEEYEQRWRALTGGVASFDRPDLFPITPAEPSAVSVSDPRKGHLRSS